MAEAYPDLKANQNFLALQEELTGTEGRIAFSRQFYNERVLAYDNALEQFPSNLIAGMFNFKEEALLRDRGGNRVSAVRVDFGQGGGTVPPPASGSVPPAGAPPQTGTPPGGTPPQAGA